MSLDEQARWNSTHCTASASSPQSSNYRRQCARDKGDRRASPCPADRAARPLLCLETFLFALKWYIASLSHIISAAHLLGKESGEQASTPSILFPRRLSWYRRQAFPLVTIKMGLAEGKENKDYFVVQCCNFLSGKSPASLLLLTYAWMFPKALLIQTWFNC